MQRQLNTIVNEEKDDRVFLNRAVACLVAEREAYQRYYPGTKVEVKKDDQQASEVCRARLHEAHENFRQAVKLDDAVHKGLSIDAQTEAYIQRQQGRQPEGVLNLLRNLFGLRNLDLHRLQEQDKALEYINGELKVLLEQRKPEEPTVGTRAVM